MCRIDHSVTPPVHMGTQLAPGFFEDGGRICCHHDDQGLTTALRTSSLVQAAEPATDAARPKKAKKGDE